MPRILKIPAKIALYFCTLFSLSPCFAFAQPVDTAWVRRYNGPGNGDDKAVALAVDSGGNVYVTGSSFDSTTGYDYATIKYLPNGDTAWVRRFNGAANGNDYAVSLAVGNDGGIYVLGTITDTISNPIGRFSSAIIKYSADGEILWIRHSGNAPDSASALTVDESGNVYIVGTLYFSYGGFPPYITADLEVVKYSSTGNVLWVRGWGFCPGSSARSIAVDKNGNVYVTGAENIAGLCEYSVYQFDYVTLKFDSAGNYLWVKNYDGGGNAFARAVAVDDKGNAYVTGISRGDIATIKYDSGGNQSWVQRFVSRFVKQNIAGGYALDLDKNSNLYVTGNAWDIEAMIWFTLKYDSLGNQLWSKTTGFYQPNPTLVLDTANNVYVAGGGLIIKYDPQGNEFWRRSSPTTAIVVDSKGNVYATGYGSGGGTGNDFATIKYSPLPALKGDLNKDGMLNLFDIVLALNCVFLGESPPDVPPSACDFNCNGLLTAVDMVILLNMAFLSVPPPC